MGGSLPAIARWLETTPEGVSWLGLLYSGNIAGAVFGCFISGFYLLRVYDMASRLTRPLRSISLIGLASLALSTRTAHDEARESTRSASSRDE